MQKEKEKVSTIQRPSDERMKSVQEKTTNESLKKSIDEKLKQVNKPFNK